MRKKATHAGWITQKFDGFAHTCIARHCESEPQPPVADATVDAWQDTCAKKCTLRLAQRYGRHRPQLEIEYDAAVDRLLTHVEKAALVTKTHSAVRLLVMLRGLSSAIYDATVEENVMWSGTPLPQSVARKRCATVQLRLRGEAFFGIGDWVPDTAVFVMVDQELKANLTRACTEWLAVNLARVMEHFESTTEAALADYKRTLQGISFARAFFDVADTSAADVKKALRASLSEFSDDEIEKVLADFGERADSARIEAYSLRMKQRWETGSRLRKCATQSVGTVFNTASIFSLVHVDTATAMASLRSLTTACVHTSPEGAPLGIPADELDAAMDNEERDVAAWVERGRACRITIIFSVLLCVAFWRVVVWLKRAQQ
uniref:Uncharacterized protein n=1 Tax=Neobodo designis TaxID=312471 RepID=A0A7S1L5F6_NEODS|mmetsp:Transcript_15232/g.47200  ORF Transcript_15232/g.47200 Transcript_15232/m.47200 type:complete len:375 (+) Transcript_15232:1237-2361(+)